MQGCLDATVSVPRNVESRVRKRKTLEANIFYQLSSFAANREQLFEPWGNELRSFDLFAIARNIFQFAFCLIEEPLAGCIEQLCRVLDKIARVSLKIRNQEILRVRANRIGELIAVRSPVDRCQPDPRYRPVVEENDLRGLGVSER